MDTSDRSVKPVQTSTEVSDQRTASYLKLGILRSVQLCIMGRLTKPIRT